MRLFTSIMTLSLLAGSACAEPVAPTYMLVTHATVTSPGDVAAGGPYAIGGSGAGTVLRLPFGAAPVPAASVPIPDPRGLAVDRQGFATGVPQGLLVSSGLPGGIGRVSVVQPNGTVATVVESGLLNNPAGVVVGDSGTMVFINAKGNGTVACRVYPDVVWTYVPATPGVTIDSIAVNRTETGIARLAVGRSDGTIALYATQGSTGEHGFLIDGAYATGIPTPMVIVQEIRYSQLMGADLCVLTGTGELRRYTAANTYTVVGTGFNDVGGAAFDESALVVSCRSEGKVYRVSCVTTSISGGPPNPNADCSPGAAQYTVTAVAAPDAPVAYRWQRLTAINGNEYEDLVDGPLMYGSAAVGSVSGTSTQTITYTPGQFVGNDAVPSKWGVGIRCLVTTPCGIAEERASLGFASTDMGKQGGLPGHDGRYDNNDFIVFINMFFAHDPSADLGTSGGLIGSDEAFNNNDFVAFIDMFFNHC